MTNGRDASATPWQDAASAMPPEHLDALTAHESIADGGQWAADSDQVASEAGQAASDRDDGDTTSDPHAADRDQARAGRERAALGRARADSERRHAEAAMRARLQDGLHGSHSGDLAWVFRRETEWHALNLEMDRSRRGDGRFVLAFLGVDGLKGINDRAGHAAGDLVLRTLLAALRSSLRSFDPVMRFGGDEFVCGIGGADVREVEGRLAGTQRSLYADTGASFSAGLAVLAAGETLEQLTARADAALLDAKASRSDRRQARRSPRRPRPSPARGAARS